MIVKVYHTHKPGLPLTHGSRLTLVFEKEFAHNLTPEGLFNTYFAAPIRQFEVGDVIAVADKIFANDFIGVHEIDSLELGFAVWLGEVGLDDPLEALEIFFKDGWSPAEVQAAVAGNSGLWYEDGGGCLHCTGLLIFDRLTAVPFSERQALLASLYDELIARGIPASADFAKQSPREAALTLSAFAAQYAVVAEVCDRLLARSS